jgi:type I restriction enzyme, R subunit
MPKGEPLSTNFAALQAHDAQLVRLGMLAERYFADDPNTSLLKLRQLAELLAQLVAAKVGIFTSSDEAQYDLLRRLQDQGILPRDVAQLFSEIRRAGNAASHALASTARRSPRSS